MLLAARKKQALMSFDYTLGNTKSFFIGFTASKNEAIAIIVPRCSGKLISISEAYQLGAIPKVNARPMPRRDANIIHNTQKITSLTAREPKKNVEFRTFGDIVKANKRKGRFNAY